jgi:hypothetical protein
MSARIDPQMKQDYRRFFGFGKGCPSLPGHRDGAFMEPGGRK